AILSIICWRGIRAGFLPSTLCGDNPTPCLWRARPRQLLHSYAFSEVAWLIHVAAEFDREMIRQKLERDDAQNRHYVIGRFRQHDDLVSGCLKMFRALPAGQRDDPPLASFYLLDVIEVF